MKIILVFIAFLFLTNCTIQKRTFNKGYFVQWNNPDFSKKTTKKLGNQILNYEKEDLLEENLAPLDFLETAVLSDTLLNFQSHESTNEKLIIKQVTKFYNSEVKSPNFNIVKNNNLTKLKKVYFDKSKGKKTLIFGLISIISFILLLIFITFFFKYNIPTVISVISFISLQLSVIVFGVLALIFLILAFIKPKNKEKVTN